MKNNYAEEFEKNGAQCHIHMANPNPSDEELREAYGKMGDIIADNLPRLETTEFDIPVSKIF